MNQGLTIYTLYTGDTIYSLQTHQKRPMCPTCDNTFIGLSAYTIPFIFTRPASSNAVTSFVVKDSEDNVVETLDNSLISILNGGSVDYIYCNFQAYGTDSLPCDLYYYEIECDTETYYSEMFRTIDKTIDWLSVELSTNGSFTSDLSGWTVDGATWSSGNALIEAGESIAQATAGTSFVRVKVSATTSNVDSFFKFGGFSLPIAVGDNYYYMPSGITFTIANDDSGIADDLLISAVSVVEVEKVECYNLIIGRNSCNKNSVPYANTGYANVFIVDGELAEPEYVREDDFDEDGEKNKSQTFLKITKKWSIKTSKPLFEPFVDELNRFPFYDTIYIFNDIWKKEFRAYQSTLDIEFENEFQFEDKCDAMVNIIINETLALSNSCCDDMTELACCEDFGWNIDAGTLSAVVLTLEEPFCIAGTRYYLDQYSSGGDLLGSIEFEDTITFDSTVGVGLTWNVRGSKFGCPDIEYPLNVS